MAARGRPQRNRSPHPCELCGQPKIAHYKFMEEGDTFWLDLRLGHKPVIPVEYQAMLDRCEAARREAP